MPNWDDIRHEWESSEITITKLAKKHNIKLGTLKSRKSREKWSRGATKKEKVATIPDEVKSVMNNPELNDKQRLFCLYYSRSFNATRSYQKAYKCSYESALRAGSELLKNVGVKAEILKLKEQRYTKELLRPEDIFQKYMDIAFADITDFVEFGQEEVPVLGMYGPVEVEDKETGKKEILTKMANTVTFRESREVDGTLITEVKQGRDGTSIKLPDRMKALEWLAGHMDLATPEQQAKVAKFNAEADLTKEKTKQIKGEDKDTGLLELLIEGRKQYEQGDI